MCDDTGSTPAPEAAAPEAASPSFATRMQAFNNLVVQRFGAYCAGSKPAETAPAVVTASPPPPSKKPPEKRLQYEVSKMMYGFGDVREPLPEAVALVEDDGKTVLHRRPLLLPPSSRGVAAPPPPFWVTEAVRGVCVQR